MELTEAGGDDYRRKCVSFNDVHDGVSLNSESAVAVPQHHVLQATPGAVTGFHALKSNYTDACSSSQSALDFPCAMRLMEAEGHSVSVGHLERFGDAEQIIMAMTSHVNKYVNDQEVYMKSIRQDASKLVKDITLNRSSCQKQDENIIKQLQAVKASMHLWSSNALEQASAVRLEEYGEKKLQATRRELITQSAHREHLMGDVSRRLVAGVRMVTSFADSKKACRIERTERLEAFLDCEMQKIEDALMAERTKRHESNGKLLLATETFLANLDAELQAEIRARKDSQTKAQEFLKTTCRRLESIGVVEHGMREFPLLRAFPSCTTPRMH